MEEGLEAVVFEGLDFGLRGLRGLMGALGSGGGLMVYLVVMRVYESVRLE